MIIGVVGQPSSGKDTVADYLASKGFLHINSSDLIREEMRELGIETTRPNISQFVINKRKERGPGYLAEKALLVAKGNAVISGLRNVEEIRILRENKLGNFILIAIEAPIEVRYERLKARGRIGDNISFDQFQAEENVERNGAPDTHQVDQVIGLADVAINNDGSQDDLKKKIDKVLEKYAG